MARRALVWFRRDLRVQDNPALSQALRDNDEVLALYVHDADLEAALPQQASGWWRQQALGDLNRALKGHLNLLQGEPLKVLSASVETWQINSVYWNRQYEPATIKRDQSIKQFLQARGVAVHSFSASLLNEPWQCLKPNQEPYRVFTPYYKQVLKAGFDTAIRPQRLETKRFLGDGLNQARLDSLSPTGAWAERFSTYWQPTRAGASELLRALPEKLGSYAQQRDFPALDATSRLSPYLHYGQVSPRQVLAAVEGSERADAFLRQLVWRDFAHAVLYHWPHSHNQPLDERFAGWPWRHAPQDLRAWQQGQTGVPIIDAAMRELWYSGTLHNRCRMLAASYLSKHLMIDWRAGAQWFMHTLLDADLANNSMGWQWCAGSGVDAAPYFRVFNPERQAQKFDPEGDYVRHWLSFPPAVEREADVLPDSALPTVDLAAGRARALSIWTTLSKTK